MTGIKPRLLLTAYSPKDAEDILDQEGWRDLLSAFRVDLVSAFPVEGVETLGCGFTQWPGHKARQVAWQAIYAARLIPFTRANFPERVSDPFLRTGYSRVIERIFPLLGLPGLRSVVVWAMQAYLHATNPLRAIMEQGYDIVVSVTGLKDPLYFDIASLARKKKVPVFAAIANWDNINTKPVLIRPDRVGVWGLQGFYIARMLQALPHEAIAVIGSQRMEPYFLPRPARSEARNELGLPQDRRILLFAGSGLWFEETSVLEEIDMAVETGELPTDIYIIYRPHPKRVERSNEKPLAEANFRHVHVIPPTGENGLPPSSLPLLFAAVDGVISPFSSLILEGALCGLPAVALGYDDPAHAEIRRAATRISLHHAYLWHAAWIEPCVERSDILPAIRALTKKLARDDIAEQARRDSSHCVFHDDRSYGQRIVEEATAMLSHSPKRPREREAELRIATTTQRLAPRP